MNIATTTNTNISTVKPQPYQTVDIFLKHSPIPDALLWHQTTSWRYAKELYKHKRTAWNNFKRLGAIPLRVIQEVEGL